MYYEERVYDEPKRQREYSTKRKVDSANATEYEEVNSENCKLVGNRDTKRYVHIASREPDERWHRKLMGKLDMNKMIFPEEVKGPTKEGRVK